MNLFERIVYGLVYVISLLIIHPALFVWGWLVFVVRNSAAVLRALWRRVQR
jgi:hypothetical protein